MQCSLFPPSPPLLPSLWPLRPQWERREGRGVTRVGGRERGRGGRGKGRRREERGDGKRGRRGGKGRREKGRKKERGEGGDQWWLRAVVVVCERRKKFQIYFIFIFYIFSVFECVFLELFL